MATSIMAARDADEAVRREAELIMEGVAGRLPPPAGFKDPVLSG
jgi:hypothetical protein